MPALLLSRIDQKYPLITYEKALLGQATGGKFPSVTFLERKKMSTKTSIKRIALVAASALAIAGFSAVPAHAVVTDTTVTFTNTASATTSPKAGAIVSLPVSAAITGVQTTAGTAILTATITTKPAASALTTQSTQADITAYAATHTGGGNTGTKTDAVAAVSGASINMVTVATDQDTTGAIGVFTFTPDVAGLYEITLTKSGTATTVFTNNVVSVNVSGAAIVQGATGLGAASGTQTTGNGSAATFFIPAASTTASTYTITASGASITAVAALADKADSISAGTAVSATNITKTNGTDFAAGINYTGVRATTGVIETSAAGHTDAVTVQFSSAVASTAVVTLKSISLTSGVATTLSTATVVFGASAVVSSTLSTAFIGQGNVCAVAANVVPITVAKTASVALAAGVTTGATICINAKDTAGAALIGQAVSVTIAGPGLVTLASGNGTGSTGTVRAASLTSTTQAATGASVVGITADGTAGTATITITVGGVVLPTKTVLFFGSVATLTATQNLKIAKTSSTANLLGSSASADASTSTATTPAVVIVAKDSLGNVVPSLTLSAVISDTTVLSATTIVEAAGAASTNGAAGPGNYLASVTSAANAVSGKTTTVTYRIADPASTTGGFITAAPLTFSVGGVVATTKISADATSYAAGAPMIITLTSKDSAGNPVFDGAASTAVTASKSVIGLPGASEYANGVAASATSLDKSSTFAPVLGGEAILRNTDSALNTSSVTVSIEGDASSSLALDAANAATDAANNAYDEAQNATQAASDALAAVTALSAQVEALIATVKSLAAMVAKIKAKVKA